MADKMFIYLSRFDRILVTGPQRSGTRIAAKMIASDLGYPYIDEVRFAVGHQLSFAKLLRETSKGVFQCPGMCHVIQKHTAPNIAIIFMRRPTRDIVASQDRIKWVSSSERSNYQCGNQPVCEAKLSRWLNSQRAVCHNCFDLHYDDLKNHPLWIPKNLRSKFKWDQTTILYKGVKP